MIYRSCFETDFERNLLFSSMEDPSKPWKASRLTNALRKLSGDVCGLDIGIQVCRQLSITVTRRHISHISKTFNRYDDKTAEASQEISFAWQSGYRPMQRGTTYGMDAAFPDSLQPALLKVYRWASDEWHNYLDKVVDEDDAYTCQRADELDGSWCTPT